jgi:shikimate dehydrogenase
MKLPSKATQPTMYFIGVTTAKSKIMQLFPLWAKALGLENAIIKGIDVEINADPEVYRKIVDFIKNDELSLGALVTTHKICVYESAKDMFDYLDPYAELCGELSCISKKNEKLEGYAKDPITSGLALESFLPKDFWKNFSGETFIIGAGGSAIALTSYMINRSNGDNVPSKLIVTNRRKERLSEIKKINYLVNSTGNREYIQILNETQNDAVLKNLKPYSLIVNATGLGKDRPGSPLTDKCEFPENSYVWEFNYRGELTFMHQALKQKDSKNLHVEDGWMYFIHGWTQVISEVFHIDITGSTLDKCIEIANRLRDDFSDDKSSKITVSNA